MTRSGMVLRAALILGGILFAVPMRSAWSDDMKPAAAQMDMDKMVAGASTPADHEQLAAMYEQEAKDARAKADMHKKMAEAYRKAGGHMVSKVHFDEHCDSLVRQYTAAAKEYDALAKAEHGMAKK